MVFRRVLYPALPVFSVGTGSSQEALRYRYQFYDEDDGRIDVESHYLDYEIAWGKTSASLRVAVDSLTGMTPTGTHAPGDPDDWLFQTITDERRVGVATIEHEVNDYTLSFEYAHSKEIDYRSNAVTGKVSRQFNQKNTTVTAGMAFAFDEVLATPFTNNLNDEDKDTFDFNFGVSQILSRNTILDLNLGYGHNRGYLGDPYRRISQQKTVIVDGPFGPIPVDGTFNFAENRPDELDRFVAKASVRHYFQQANAALSCSYRFFANTNSIEGHTFEVKWIQEINRRLSVTPYLRYYTQSEADFYYPSLTGTGIEATDRIDGGGPNYSSDYRLSKFEALTYGLRVAWEPIDNMTLDVQWERYEMDGLNSETPASFFPSANVLSVGAQFRF
ncbi:MAG: DUF3570 domain-containing protein [Akkermansiaceae bacterium]|jgi:hypothetical protein